VFTIISFLILICFNRLFLSCFSIFVVILLSFDFVRLFLDSWFFRLDRKNIAPKLIVTTTEWIIIVCFLASRHFL
jgi:hypothetical protein